MLNCVFGLFRTLDFFNLIGQSTVILILLFFVITGNEQQPSAETESNNVGVKKENPDAKPHQRNDNDRKPKQSQTRTVEAEINEVRGQNTFSILFQYFFSIQ